MTPPKRSFNILNVNLWGHGGLGVKTFASYLQGTYILIYLKIFKAYFLNVFFFFLPFSFSVFQFLFHFSPPLSLSLSRCPYDYTDLFVLMSSSDSTRIDRMLWGEVRWDVSLANALQCKDLCHCYEQSNDSVKASAPSRGHRFVLHPKGNENISCKMIGFIRN